MPQRKKPEARRLQRPKFPTEEYEQKVVIAWAKAHEAYYPRLMLLHASMNGILTNVRFAAKLKSLGRKAGVPDLFLPCSQVIWDEIAELRLKCGLFIEMKRTKGGTVSDEQEWWHAALRAQGYEVKVARGATEAIKTIKEYLEI